MIRDAASVDDFTLEGAKDASRNCERCNGGSFAFIYNPEYHGSAVIREIDDRGHIIQKLMRATAFCVCPMGRKVAVLNQQNPESKEFFLRTPDLHDVIDRKHPGWIADDPTDIEDYAIDIEALPDSMKRLAAKLKAPKIYRELAP